MAGAATKRGHGLNEHDTRDLKTLAARALQAAGWNRNDVYTVLTASSVEGIRIVETMKNEVTATLRSIVTGKTVGGAIQITTKEVLEAVRLIMDRLDPITQKMQIDSRSQLMILSDKEEIELNRKIGIRDGHIPATLIEEADIMKAGGS